ncbi:MAG: hypothetical protein HQ519_12135 [Planctomycetes bacterium]|nr:hypothetical protein [Planctomycetota bacterium]
MKQYQLLLAAILLASTACSIANPIPLTSAALDEARVAAAREDWDEAWDLLNDFDSEDLDRATLVDFHKLAGDVAWQRERITRAVRHYENYLQLRGPGEDSRKVEMRLFQAGNEMLQGEHRTLGLFSNKSRGRVTLQNLAGWSPESPLAPEALATVGEYSYENGYYKEAATDFHLLLSRYRGSEWGDLATFRLGMCGFKRALKAATNIQLIQASNHQLQNYQSLYPNGRYLDESKGALEQLASMEIGYFEYLGEYYQTVGNENAAAHYFQKAADL